MVNWFKNRKAKRIRKLKLEIAELEAKVQYAENVIHAANRTPWYFIDEMKEDKARLAVAKTELSIEVGEDDRKTNPR